MIQISFDIESGIQHVISNRISIITLESKYYKIRFNNIYFIVLLDELLFFQSY